MRLSLVSSLVPAACLLVQSAALPLTSTAAGHEPGQATKYFHEAARNGVDPDWLFDHYDARFFQRLLQYEEHRQVERHMARAYLETSAALGIESWLAHGTLLGWWWNNATLPWDGDVDVQVSETTLLHLGEHLNQTAHRYTVPCSSTCDVPSTRTYLLDVNPHVFQRDRGEGLNIIEARWIDMATGTFIDITGLREMDADAEPGVLTDKNYHKYKASDIYPLRMSEFEGVPVLVPHSPKPILIEEYGEQSLVGTSYEGHYWNPVERQWVKQAVLVA